MARSQSKLASTECRGSSSYLVCCQLPSQNQCGWTAGHLCIMKGWDIYAIRQSFKRAQCSLVSFQTAWEERKRPGNEVIVKHVMRCICMEKKAPWSCSLLLVWTHFLKLMGNCHLLYVHSLLYLSSRSPIQWPHPSTVHWFECVWWSDSWRRRDDSAVLVTARHALHAGIRLCH